MPDTPHSTDSGDGPSSAGGRPAPGNEGGPPPAVLSPDDWISADPPGATSETASSAPREPEGRADESPYGQPPYGQGGHGAPPYGPPPYGQAPYGPPPYGQPPYGPPPYGQPPYGPPPYGQGPYEPHGPGGYYGWPQQGPYRSQPYQWPYAKPVRQRTPEERRRRFRHVIVFAAVLIVALGGGIGIGAAIAPTNPATVARALVSNSVAAATKAGFYHYSELSTTLGVPDDITGAATPDGGRQAITERCSTGVNVFDLRLVNGAVYFKGNGPAMIDQLGVSSSTAKTDLDRWVKVTKKETPYQTFALGITAKSNVSQLSTTFLARASKQSSDTTDIVGGLDDHGKAIGTATLVVTSSSTLPRTFNADEVGTSGRLTLTWTFTHFGQVSHVGVPSNTISFASLHAKKPPKTVCG